MIQHLSDRFFAWARDQDRTVRAFLLVLLAAGPGFLLVAAFTLSDPDGSPVRLGVWFVAALAFGTIVFRFTAFRTGQATPSKRERERAEGAGP